MSKLDFNSLFGNPELNMECPNCHNKITFTLKDVGSTLKCSKCSTLITLKKDRSFDKSIKSIDDSLKDLDNVFKKFGK
ncbi:MAG: hypothetical protein N3E37_05675 [Candidatus Micrarchaeota archaeon]|nr:hypothetical protein [Candidatus Micrarchaeota archaeon]